MRKLYTIIIIIFVALIIFFYLSFVGIQNVSTDKKVYSLGDNIKIHWLDLSLKKCSCMDKDIEIFKETTDGWEKIQYILYDEMMVCVNDEIVNTPFACDVIFCSIPKPNFDSGDFSWNSKIYEEKGLVNSCNNKSLQNTIVNYEYKNAPTGKYKIKFGNFNKIIEIK